MALHQKPIRRGLRAATVAALIFGAGFGAAQAEVQAGYDKGFFIKSDAFEAHFGIRIQTQISSTRPDTFMYDSLLGHDVDTKNDNELSVRRFKFYGTGTAFTPSVKWKFQLDVERFKAGGGSSGNVRLEEAYVDLTARPWTQLRIGQFKVPFGYEKMTSSGKLNLVDRSIVHSFFGVNQEPGLNLFGQSFGKKFRYDVAVSTGVSDNTGFDTKNEIAANGGSDYRYMARFTWEPLDPYVWEQGAVTMPDKAQLSLQLGAMVNRDAIPQDKDPFMPKGAILPFGRDVLGANSSTFPADTATQLGAWSTVSNDRKAYDRNELELVTAWKYRRVAVEGQAVVGNVDPQMRYLQAKDPNLQDLTFCNTGFRVQASVFARPTKLELVGRYATVNRDAKAEFASSPTVRETIDQREVRAGLNWYFSKHDWKWQTDIGRIDTEWKLNSAKLAVPHRGDFAGPPPGTGFDDKMIQNNTRKDYEIRSQFQVQF